MSDEKFQKTGMTYDEIVTEVKRAGYDNPLADSSYLANTGTGGWTGWVYTGNYSFVTVGENVRIHLSSGTGATAKDFTVENGGMLIVSQGTTAFDTVVRSSGILEVNGVLDNGNVKPGFASDTFIDAGGTMTLHYASTNNTRITSGGKLIASNLTAQKAGEISLGNVVQDSGGALVYTLASIDGNPNVPVNGVNANGGFSAYTSNVGQVKHVVASNFLLESGGILNLEAGDKGAGTVHASDTIIRNSGTVIIGAGTDANTITQESGGAIVVTDGSIVINGYNKHGHFHADGNYFYSFDLENGGALTLNRGSAYNTTVSSGGSMMIGGTASANWTGIWNSGTVIFNNGSMGYTSVFSGGTLSAGGGAANSGTLYDVTVSRGGNLILSGGIASNVYVSNGASLTLNTLATVDNLFTDNTFNGNIDSNIARNMQLNNGFTLEVDSKGQALNTMVSSGGILKADNNETEAAAPNISGAVISRGGTLVITGNAIATDVKLNSSAIFSATTDAQVTGTHVSGSFSLGSFADLGETSSGFSYTYNNIVRSTINVISSTTHTGSNVLVESGGRIIVNYTESVTSSGNATKSGGITTSTMTYSSRIDQGIINGFHLNNGGTLEIKGSGVVTELEQQLTFADPNNSGTRLLSGGIISATTDATLTTVNGNQFGSIQQRYASGLYLTSGSLLEVKYGANAKDLTIQAGAMLKFTDHIVVYNEYSSIVDINSATATGLKVFTGAAIIATTSNTLSGNYYTYTNADLEKEIGSFYVKDGEAYNLRMENGGKFTVFHDDRAVSTTVGDSGTLALSAGANASATTVLSGGIQYISGGNGSYEGAQANVNWLSGGTQVVYGGSYGGLAAGGAANYTSIFEGGVQKISSGGIGNDTVIEADGTQILYTGGVANRTNVKSDGVIVANSGAFVNSVTLESGGIFMGNTLATVSNGVHRNGQFSIISGTANNILVENGGLLYVMRNNRANSTTIAAGGSAFVSCTGSMGTVQLESNGKLEVQVGGSATGIIQQAGGAIVADTLGTLSGDHAGGAFYIKNGIASNMLLENGGSLLISATHSASKTTVNSGGLLTVASAAQALGVTVGTFGSAWFRVGGSSTDVTLASRASATVESGTYISGMIQAAGAALIVDGRATILNGTNASGTFYIQGLKTSNVLLESGGHLDLTSGVTASGSILNNGGSQTVHYSATAIDTIINSGGVEIIDQAHVSGTIIRNGGLQIVTSDRFRSNYETKVSKYHDMPNTTLVTISSGGRQVVSNYGMILKTTVSSGGNLLVSATGHATSTTISKGGVMDMLGGGALSSETHVVSGGTMNVSSGASAWKTYISNGIQNVYKGGDVTFVEIYSGGIQNVSEGGLVQSTVVNISGTQNVYYLGTVNSTILNSGSIQNVYSGATVRATTVNDYSSQMIASGAEVTSTTVNINGYVAVADGGAIRDITVNDRGKFFLGAGGSANIVRLNSGAAIETTTDAIITNGILLGSSTFGIQNHVASNFQLTANGLLTVKGNGTLAGDTIIYKGGRINMVKNATFQNGVNLDLKGGLLNIEGDVRNVSGATVNFDYAGQNIADGKDIRINDIAYLDGAAFNITVSAQQDSGIYQLAGGAKDFAGKVFTINVENGGTMDIIVGGTSITIGDATYTLGISKDAATRYNLTLTIEYLNGRTYTNEDWSDAHTMLNKDKALGTILYNSGSLTVASGGSALTTVVTSGGKLILEAGGVLGVNSVGINRNSIQYSGMAQIRKGGMMVLGNGATVSGTIDLAGQLQAGTGLNVANATIAMDLTGRKTTDDYLIDNIANLDAAKFSITINATQGTGLYLLAGGAANFDKMITINVGNASGEISLTRSIPIGNKLYSLVENNGNLYLSVSTGLDPAGDKLNIYSGQYGSGSSWDVGANQTQNVWGKTWEITIAAGGSQIVYGGGNDERAQLHGTQTVLSGGTVTGATVTGGTQIISEGGLAQSTVLSSGGQLQVLSGGVANNVSMANRSAVVTVFTGATVSLNTAVANTGTLNFRVTGKPSDKLSVADSKTLNNLSLSITVDGNTQIGTYSLAGNAAEFGKTISIKAENGSTIGLLTVGGSLVYGNFSYTLSVKDDKLSFTVETVNTVKSDFFGTGKSDLLFYGTNSNELWVWKNGNSEPPIMVGTADRTVNKIVGISDFNADGHADVLWQSEDGTVGYWGSADPSQWHQIGNASPNDNKVMATTDFNGNGKADILWKCANGDVGLWLDGTNQWQQIGTSNDNNWSIAAVGDLDGNGKKDIVWVDKNNNVGIWSDGTSEWTGLGQGAAGWTIAGTAHFGNTEKEVLLWTNSSTGEVGYWTNGNEWTSLGGSGNGDWKVAGTADFDGNGCEDLVWRNQYTGEVGCWTDGDAAKWKYLGNGTGDFNTTIGLAG